MIKNLNHITLAVKDIDLSFEFYREVLGFKPTLKWKTGAYFDIGGTWFCLSYDPDRKTGGDYTHIAFSIDQKEFDSICGRLKSHNIRAWKENKSEGDSFYFLDPDDHKLELHVGDMNSRLEYYKKSPPEGAKFY